MPEKAHSGNMSVAGVVLAEILAFLSLLPFNLTPRFKVKCDSGTLNLSRLGLSVSRVAGDCVDPT
jgi:hypothetical protein